MDSVALLFMCHSYEHVSYFLVLVEAGGERKTQRHSSEEREEI
jgi:hypothetical protein